MKLNELNISSNELKSNLKKTPKVSIIVPVYKVEDYLARCVNSIFEQTFRDFEIILVDDGSPDNCGQMCDEYAKNDSRVIVIHKSNGGLSDARNAGIDYAITKSESTYICFFDSDDFVKPDLLECSISAAERHNADIVCFGIEMTDEELNILNWGTSHIPNETVYEGHEVLFPLFPPNFIGDYACNKIFKKDLFSKIRFPFQKQYEDVYTSYKVFSMAQKVVVIPENFYVYIRRKGSITRAGQTDIKIGILNFFYANVEKYNFVLKNEPQLKENAMVGVVNSALLVANNLLLIKDSTIYESVFETVSNTILKNWNLIKRNSFLNKKDILACKALKNGFNSYSKYKTRSKKKASQKEKLSALSKKVKSLAKRILHL